MKDLAIPRPQSAMHESRRQLVLMSSLRLMAAELDLQPSLRQLMLCTPAKSVRRSKEMFDAALALPLANPTNVVSPMPPCNYSAELFDAASPLANTTSVVSPMVVASPGVEVSLPVEMCAAVFALPVQNQCFVMSPFPVASASAGSVSDDDRPRRHAFAKKEASALVRVHSSSHAYPASSTWRCGGLRPNHSVSLEGCRAASFGVPPVASTASSAAARHGRIARRARCRVRVPWC